MPESEPEQTMSLGEHLDELRTRLLLAMVAVGLAFVACWLAKDVLMSFVVGPHAAAMQSLGLPVSLRLIRYQEGFYSYMKVAFLAALVLASPFVAYQIWAFVRSGLRPAESALALKYGFASLGLFLAGAAFGFFVLIPLGLRFLAAVGMGVAQPMISMSEYVSLVTMLTLVAAFIFELPLVIRFLVKLGVAEAETLARHRRLAILGAVVLGAVLTPPDPFTQMLLAMPIVGLYELGLVVAEPTLKRALRLLLLVGLVVALGAGIGLRRHWMRQRAARFAGTGAPVSAGSRVHAADGRLDMTLRNGATVAVRRGSVVRVEGADRIFLESGEILVRSPAKGRSATVATEDVEFMVEDAEAHALATGHETVVTCARGAVMCFADDREQLVAAGRRRRFSRGGEPTDVEDVVSWAQQEEEGAEP